MDRPWDPTDDAAVAAIVGELCAESARESRSWGATWVRAHRSYFARTGRVRSHDNSGYGAGCRCVRCRTDNNQKQVLWRAARKAAAQ